MKERNGAGKLRDIPYVYLYMYIFILRVEDTSVTWGLGFCLIRRISPCPRFPSRFDARGEYNKRVCCGRRILFLARSHAEGDGERRRRQGSRETHARACIRCTATAAAGILASLATVISSVKMRALRYLVIRSSLRAPPSKAFSIKPNNIRYIARRMHVSLLSW